MLSQLLTDAGKRNKPRRTVITLSTFGVLILVTGGLVYAIHPLFFGLIGLSIAGIGVLFKNLVFGIVDISNWLGIDLRF